jgi:hypothetical protein
MTEPHLMRAALLEPKDQLAVPVKTPVYTYLVADLLTDQLLANIPLTGVTFDRRVSRVGSFNGTWNIPNREQAILADDISKNGGRYALWVMRDKVVWWGGIIWNCSGSIATRGYDTVGIQAATFDSYLDHRFLDNDWEGLVEEDLAYGPIDVWDTVQAFTYSDIGVITTDSPANLAGSGLPALVVLAESDQKTYNDAIRLYTDAENGCDYTIDVFQDTDGSRIKKLRTAGSFALVQPASKYTISGYRLPAWTFERDATKGGTYFRVWGDPQDGNAGAEVLPVSSNYMLAQDLLDAGWPRLDVSADIGELPQTGYQARLDAQARALRARYSGIKDIVTFDVDLGTSQWHPNLIGQNVIIKRSKKDLWRPGETSTITPVVVEFTAPERGAAERVKFTIDGAEEG